MDLDQLIAELTELRDATSGDRPVKIAYQPHYPIAEAISRVSAMDDGTDQTIYIAGSDSTNYAPRWVFHD